MENLKETNNDIKKLYTQYNQENPKEIFPEEEGEEEEAEEESDEHE
jgi:hypothetical protein